MTAKEEKPRELTVKIFNVLKQIILQLFGGILIIIVNVIGVILAGVGVILVLVLLKYVFLLFKFMLFQ